MAMYHRECFRLARFPRGFAGMMYMREWFLNGNEKSKKRWRNIIGKGLK
jgi:hypothetical protein